MANKPTKRERKDEAKKRRMEEMRRRKRRARRRKLTTYGIVAAIVAAIVGTVLISRASNKRAEERAAKIASQAGCEPSRGHTIEGQTHVQTGQKVSYSSEPPTSGNHWASGQQPFAPSPTGILAQNVPDEAGVHNLEHGHILVQYQPGQIPAPVMAKLEALARANGKSMLLAPRPNRDAKLVLSAWGRSQKCANPNDKADEVVKDFHNRFRNQGPEQVEGSPIFQTPPPATSPTPTGKTTPRPRPTTTPRATASPTR